MITLFAANETDFTHNGLGSLDRNIITPVVEETLNGLYAFSFTYPIFAPHGIQIDGQSIVRVPTPKGNQLFRVYKPIKSMGYLTVHCYHIFYDLVDNFIEDTNIVAKFGQGAISQLGGATQYAHMFQFFSDIITIANARIVRMNPVEALLDSGKANSFISRWGGELDRDNLNVRMMEAIGSNRGVTIRHKKDLVGYEAEVDWSTVVTRIMPKGFDGLLLPEKYVDSPYLASYAFPKIQMVDYGDIKAAIGENADAEDAVPLDEAYELLRAAATFEFSVNQIDVPRANYKVEFAPLAETEEYKDYKSLETVLIGDTVTVIHGDDGLQIAAKVISYKYDPMAKKYISIELGNYQEKFSSTAAKVQDLENNVGQLESTVNSVQLSADGKNSIYRGPDEPLNPNENDFWYHDLGDTVQMKQWTGSGWDILATSADDLKGEINFGNLSVINFTADNIVAGDMDVQKVRVMNGLEEVLVIDNTTGQLRLNGNFLVGETNSDLTMNLTNGKLAFEQQGLEVAYFSNNKLYVTDAEFLKSVIIGNYAFIPRTNGNLSFKWVGE